ncbi:uncharacterized protein LOC132707400 isoform X2 [Cylas formicarius]|uniref:uncharacterized protein LOC132707400 isoform X2 n=1 Tax=Cylas formicarius TaxID=197179 RepID=UPI002958760E|nr:uncharacterized protein LOC132707400 isoform X2 [Cylas formicarius]
MEKIVEMYNQTSSDIEKTTTLANKTTAVEPESASVSLKIDVFKDHEATFETSTRFQKRITDIEKGGFPWVMDEIVSSTIFETSITETEQTEYAMFTEPTDYQVLYYGKDVTSSTKHYLPETSDVETKPKTPTEIDRYGAITSEVAELQISETSESHKMHDVTGMASKKDFYDFVSTKCAICNDEFVLTTSDENALSSLATQIEIEDKEIKETAKEATHTSLVGKVTEKTSHTVDTERTVVSEEDMGEERHFETEIARRDTTYSGDILDSEIQEELDTEAIVTDSVGVAETAITKFGEAEDEATHLESVVGEYSESEELEFEEKEDTDESEEELSTEEEEKELEEDESFEEQTEEEYETTETEEDESCESAEEPSYDEFSTSAMDYTKSLPSVDDDSFIMRQVTEAVVVKRPTRKEHKKKFMRGPTIKDEKLITTEQITAKPLVIVVNDSGRKLGKINETVLEKIANKSASNIDLEYVDLRNISVDLPKRNRSALWVGFPTESCDKEDFEANNNCLCNMEDHLSSLLHKANRKESPKFDIFHCSKFVRPKKGLLIDTMIKPMKRPRRSLIYLQNRSGSEVVEYQNMETLFEDGYKLETSDKNIFALPGSTVEIPCRGKVDRLIHSDHGLHWKFKTSDGTEGEELPETGNLLTLHEVAVKNAGIYTCSKVDKDDAVKVHSHELEVVAFPVYDVRMNVFYVVNVSCDLKDGDILYSYLPKVMAPALCGSANQACFVDVARPRCISRENDNIYNVSISVKIKPDGHFVNSLHELRNCDINCALRFYANIVGLVYKNAEIIQHIPVYSKLPSTSAIEFVPYFSRNPKSPVSTKPPKVAVSCLGGYGLESLKQRVCVVCPKHTFSAADEAFCKSCPAGQYQPERASELCLQCSSPVEDAMCLRMLVV